jgi:hypothetical protein
MWVSPGIAVSPRCGTATDPLTITTESRSLSRKPGAVHLEHRRDKGPG